MTGKLLAYHLKSPPVPLVVRVPQFENHWSGLNPFTAVLLNFLKDRPHSFVQHKFHSHTNLALLKNSRIIGLDF